MTTGEHYAQNYDPANESAQVDYLAGWKAAIEWAAGNFRLDDGFYGDQVRDSILEGLTKEHKELEPGQLPF